MKILGNIIIVGVLFASDLSAQIVSHSQLKNMYSSSPANYNLVSKKPGHYTAEDWAIVIDTTWGEGLSTQTKLALFDEAWNMFDDNYAAFQNLDVDWQAIYDLYRPEIEEGVSRGRFDAIMNYMALTLQELHSWVWDDFLTNTPLDSGIPLFCVGSNSDNTSHFGATLTPLPDSSLLVIKALPDHPLGLIPGDQVLGYDGISWKILYKELLAAQLPIYKDWYKGWAFPSSDNKNLAHLYLVSAGMNWHLFDTLDVVKYGNTDTLHYPTSSLAGQNDFIWGNEQLPVPGVPWPYEGTENIMDPVEFGDFISWETVEGTNIGYIYALAWADNEQVPGSNISIEFFNAVDSLMNHYETEGLIIDQRLNFGGRTQFQEGFSLLFNNIFQSLGFDRRCDPDNHFEMCSYTFQTLDLITNGDPETFHDRPIAVLTGPASVSAGDWSALILKMHPMARLFGKSTNGAFSSYSSRYLKGNDDWPLMFTRSNAYPFDEPGNYLAHKALAVNEEVWLTQEDVAKGEDTVVKRAIEWIKNLSYAHDVTVDKTYAVPETEKVVISTIVENPNQHDLSVNAELNDMDDIFIDSLNLFDDGIHGDGSANDNLWGNIYQPTDEQSYKISVTTNDLSEETSRTLPNVAWFTTIGRIVVESDTITSNDKEPNPGDNLKFLFKLHNQGSQAIATDITAKIIPLDTCVSLRTTIVANYGDIAPGESVLGNRSQYIRFSDKCTDGYQTQFAMKIYSNGYHFWSDTFQIDVISGLEDENISIMKEFKLHQNFPNPFNPNTVISWQLAVSSDVELSIYNLLGQKIETLVNKPMPAGYHEVEFNGQNLSSGVYLYRIEVEDSPGRTGEWHNVKKMILIK